jgi:cell division transport system permease protein
VNKGEAYNRMVEVLGDEADVLKIFEENPFSPMIEVKIHLNQVDQVLNELEHLTGVDHVQNNKAVLERLRDLTGMVRVFGVMVLAAVGISTLIIISQIIRLGIQNNSEQINTLRLLGAPEFFIAFPFVLQGLLLTFGGGLLAALLAAVVIKQGYGQIAGHLSFVPLLPAQTMMSEMTAAVLLLSLVLGMGGSLIGLTSARDK